MNDAFTLSLTMNPYLFGSIILMVIWLYTYWRVKRRKDVRDLREFWWASFTCCPLGVTEPLYVPKYWNLPSVLKFYRWDMESFIFCFVIGGVAAVFTELPKIKSIARAIDNTLWDIFGKAILLIKRAFEGKVLQQDQTDEPAEKLLERIKIEKAARDKENGERKRERKSKAVSGRLAAR